MHWMPLVLQELESTVPAFKRFHGTDVVCSLIERHKATFASHANWNFT
jgi:hypothetical protein